MLIFIFFLLHVATVCLVLNEKRKKNLFLNPVLLLILCLFPVVGVVSVFIANRERAAAAAEEAPAFEEVIPWLSDESFADETDTSDVTNMDTKEIIPLQEALLLNNASIKRSLIIDLVFEQPDQFVPLLYQARLNEDIEVVHYATTILSELTSKYDAKLQELEEQMKEDPDSLQAKKDYLQFLQQYMDSQLAEGYYARMLRRRYTELVERLQQEGLLLEKKYFIKLGEIYLELQDMQRFSRLLKKMQQLFPDEEETWMLRLKAIVTRKSPQELSKFFREIKEKRIYLSARNREIVAFWQ